MNTPRRRISMSELGETAAAPSSTDAAQFGQMFSALSAGLSKVNTLVDRVSTLEKENKALFGLCEAIQKSCGKIDVVAKQLSTYMVEHAALHRDMAKERGTAVEDLVRLVRNVTGQAAAMNDTVGSALKEMSSRRDVPVILETRVNAPAVNVTVEAPEHVEPDGDEAVPYTFDVKRNRNGLIDSVVARPGVPRSEQH
jgi:hypothetical protein